MATSVTVNGITWNFDDDYTVGQYTNGDYWVVDPGAGIIINSIDHGAVEGVEAEEGSTKNPRYGVHGYDSRAGGYSAGSAVSFPATLVAGDCIVTCTRLTTQDHTYLYSGAVLNCVDEAQSADKFRPPYCRPSRVADSSEDPLIFSSDDIQWGLLPSLTPPNGGTNVPALATSEALVANVQLDHLGESWRGEIRPQINLAWYGREFQRDISIVACQLLLDYSQAQKTNLCKYLIQAGIDFFGIMEDGGNWHADGGLQNGAKFPIVFAGMMLNSATLKAFDRFYDTNKPLFSDDAQTYYHDDVNLPAYVGDPPTYTDYAESGAGRHLCEGVLGWIDILNGGSGDEAMWRLTNNGPDFGSSAVFEEQHISLWSDNVNYQRKSEAYRLVSSPGYVGIAIALLKLGAHWVNCWAHNALLHYVYRWMTQDTSGVKVLFDIKFAPNTYPAETRSSNNDFVDDMWNAYGYEYSAAEKLVMVLK